MYKTSEKQCSSATGTTVTREQRRRRRRLRLVSMLAESQKPAMTTSPSEEASWKKPDSTQRKKSFTIAPHWRQLGSYRGSGRCNGRRDNGPTCMGLNAAGERPRRRWESPNALLSLCGGLLLALPCLFTRLHCGTGTSLPRRTHSRTHEHARNSKLPPHVNLF